MLPADALASLRTSLDCQPIGAPIGNLTLAKGVLGGRSVLVAIVEPRFALGALGVAECDKLAGLFRVAASTRQALVLYLDSAGAKLSEGLPALGAFRRMYACALAAVHEQAPILAICGANCFGGASMLAALGARVLYCDNSRLAMSGPAILAQAAGVDALDPMFRAMAEAAIGAGARVTLGDGQAHFEKAHLQSVPTPLTPAGRQERLALRAGARRRSGPAAQPLRRRDLEKLYPEGYDVLVEGHALRGSASHRGAHLAVLGWVGTAPMGAAGALTLADWALELAASPPNALHVLVECEAHAATLDDERVMLSAYLAHLAAALHSLAARGTRITTIVLGTVGGGVYVALAAPAAQVAVVHGAQIQLLPGRAIASILGAAAAQAFAVDDYLRAGVAESELRLGLV
jgi:acetyl-CoA carboxylase beta subunit